MHKELDKCKVYLHDSRQTAKKKSQPAHNVQQMVLEQDEHYLKNKLNRSGRGQSPAVPNRFDAFYLQHFMSEKTSPKSDAQATAVAVMSYNSRGLIQGRDIDKRGLHSSQLRHEPGIQMNLFMEMRR